MKQSTKKKWMYGILFLFIGLCLLDIGIGNYLLNFAVVNTSKAGSSIHSSLNSAETKEQIAFEQKALQTKEKFSKEAVAWDEKTKKEQVKIESFDHLKLMATYYPMDYNVSHKWVILLHGYNSSSKDMLTYAQNFQEKGYQVLNIDQRSYGKSQGNYTGMGWIEKDDLKRWISYVIKKDPKAQIVLQGVSMGAATVMMAAGDGLPHQVKAIIEDCGYTSVWDEFSNKLSAIFHLPSFPLLNTASILCQVRMGYNFKEASSVEQLKKNQIPMLFIHGSKDTYNPFWMEDALYKADGAKQKQKLVIKGARHAMSAFSRPKVYWTNVWGFTEKYVP